MDDIYQLRFDSGYGERYMERGSRTVRCQEVSKIQLRLMRIQQRNPELSAEDAWPDAQCPKPAERGSLLCASHNRKEKNKDKKRSADFLSPDLKQKFEIFENSPDLLSRYTEMAQIIARNAQIQEQMNELILGEEAWESVSEGIKLVKRGEINQGVSIIENALYDTKTERENWEELRKNWDMLLKFHKTQIDTEEKLKTMATLDQIKSLVNGAFQSLRYILESNIDDKNMISHILMLWAADLRQLAGAKRSNVGLLDE